MKKFKGTPAWESCWLRFRIFYFVISKCCEYVQIYIKHFSPFNPPFLGVTFWTKEESWLPNTYLKTRHKFWHFDRIFTSLSRLGLIGILFCSFTVTVDCGVVSLYTPSGCCTLLNRQPDVQYRLFEQRYLTCTTICLEGYIVLCFPTCHNHHYKDKIFTWWRA